MYTSLFLDLDNTLLDFNKAEAYAVGKVLKENGLPFDEATVKLYSEINRGFWESFERGEIPKSAIYTGRFEKLLSVLKKAGNPQSLSKQYGEALSYGFFTVEGAFALLDYLKNKSYRIYATTNGLSTTQYRRIEGSGLGKYFDKIFVSEDAGHQKPEKAYFDYVISNIPESDKSKMLILGDSQSSDILGGINAGIDTCWYNPEGVKAKYPSKYTIASLEELMTIL